MPSKVERIEGELAVAKKAYAEATTMRDRLYWLSEMAESQKNLKIAQQEAEFESMLEEMIKG